VERDRDHTFVRATLFERGAQRPQQLARLTGYEVVIDLNLRSPLQDSSQCRARVLNGSIGRRDIDHAIGERVTETRVRA